MNKFIIYTNAPKKHGGGGRLLFNKLISQALNLQHKVYILSSDIYDTNFIDIDSKDFNKINFVYGKQVDKFINENNDIKILCDNEYSLADFKKNYKSAFLKDIKTFSLVHDQIWRDHVGFYKFFYKSLRGNNSVAFSNSLLEYRYSKINIFYWYIKSLVNSIIRLRSQKKLLKNCNAIFCLTERSAIESEEIYGIKAFSAIGFFDHLNTEPLIKNKKHVNSFLTFARFSPEKNLDFIISAYQKYRFNGGTSKIVLTGRAESRHEKKYLNSLKQLVNRLQLNNYVSFFENPDNDKLKSLIQEARTFICAQNADFNLTICEMYLQHLNIIVPVSNAWVSNYHHDGVFTYTNLDTLSGCMGSKPSIANLDYKRLLKYTYRKYYETIYTIINE